MFLSKNFLKSSNNPQYKVIKHHKHLTSNLELQMDNNI